LRSAGGRPIVLVVSPFEATMRESKEPWWPQKQREIGGLSSDLRK
jgi:hypothetical protein